MPQLTEEWPELATAGPCRLCPRQCGQLRDPHTPGRHGRCGPGSLPVVARAAPHMWEEPCLSGERGAGAVFFSGCCLQCLYCQNYAISSQGQGREISVARLRQIFFDLLAQGVHNIDLVNPTHFVPAILAALADGLPAPVVYNSGGYERTETLRRLEGRIQIYLPDLKYLDADLARRWSGAGDYPAAATAAIREMYRQRGPYRLDADGLLQSGVIVRHLILPGAIDNSLAVLDWLAENFRPGQVLLSLMAQYTPAGRAGRQGTPKRVLRQDEYDRCLEHLWELGWEDGFVQELTAADSAYIPAFDNSGVLAPAVSGSNSLGKE